MAKSQFLSGFDLEGEDGKLFRRGLDMVSKLPNTVLLKLAEGVPQLSKTATARLRNEFIARQLGSLGISRVEAGLAVDFVLLPMVRVFTNEVTKADRPQDIVGDLQDLKLIAPSDAPKLLKVMRFLKEQVVPQVEKDQLLQSHAVGVLPSLKSIGTTVEIRGVFLESFRLGQAIGKYRPKLVNSVPVVSIHIGTDAEVNKEFIFQADKEELQWLIDAFSAAQKELTLLEKLIGFRESK